MENIEFQNTKEHQLINRISNILIIKLAFIFIALWLINC